MAVPSRFSGIRARILAIALVPNVCLLGFGLAGTGHLLAQAHHTATYARAQESTVEPIRALVLAVEQERLLSIWHLTGGPLASGELTAARTRFDAALADMVLVEGAYHRSDSAHLDAMIGAFDQLESALPALRYRIDTGRLTVADAYTFYSRLLDGMDQGNQIVREYAPDAASVLTLTRTLNLLRMVESTARARALTIAAAAPGGLPPVLMRTYQDMVGYYHGEAAQLAGELAAPYAGRLETIMRSPQWQQSTAVENAVLYVLPAAGTSAETGALPIPLGDYRDISGQVDDRLVTLWGDQDRAAQQRTAAVSARSVDVSLLGGAALAAVAVLAFSASLVLANRLIGRLRRLRSETLALADHLPATLGRLTSDNGSGAEMPIAPLDFGSDEIGSVATAFNQAHAAAIAAAATEARTRDGVRAVFLNIAHRSQVVVRAQLAILDQAERDHEDPAAVSTLFRLDHLVTRERRNAENLIILAGGRPGRQWLDPVPLRDLVRGAVSETLHYPRVHLGRFPASLVLGTAAADLIHLLAELIDNATTFSPPHTRVDVDADLVGGQVLIRISDQGVGMDSEALDRANTLLARQPDFSVSTLSANSRLGLIVIAQLCARQAISIELGESDYGGVRATVTIPHALIADEYHRAVHTSVHGTN